MRLVLDWIELLSDNPIISLKTHLNDTALGDTGGMASSTARRIQTPKQLMRHEGHQGIKKVNKDEYRPCASEDNVFSAPGSK